MTGTWNLAGIAVNDVPVVKHPLLDQTAPLNQPFSFQIASDTFSDPDDDPLTYTAAQSGNSKLPSWLQFNGVTRFFSGTPNQTSVTPINVTASDPQGLTASTVFNINVQSNTNPEFNGGLIGGVIGGLAAVGGLAGAAYLAYKRGFFASLSKNRSEDDSYEDSLLDTATDLKKRI